MSGQQQKPETATAGSETADLGEYLGDLGAVPVEDPEPAAPAPKTHQQSAMPEPESRGKFSDRTALQQKLSFTFAKTGSSCFFSHHDLMRHFERALRRAGLAARLTDGFNPRPRMVFPHPLSLGVASTCEEIEIEFSEFVSPADAFERLKSAAEPVVELKAFTVMKPVKHGRIVHESEYTITGWADEATAEAARAAVERLLAKPEIVVTRGHAEKARPLNIRPLIKDLRVAEGKVVATLLHNEAGMGRADEIGQLLVEELELHDSIIQITRTALHF